MIEERGLNNDEKTTGIWLDLFHAYPDLHNAFKNPESLSYKAWTRIHGVNELPSRIANMPGGSANSSKPGYVRSAKVAMVVNPSIHCGIREHTSYFTEHLKTPCVTVSQDPRAPDFYSVVADCLVNRVTVAHIQHEFSLFLDRSAFTRLLTKLKESKIKIVLDLHTGSTKEEDIKDLTGWAGMSDEVITHSDKVSAVVASSNPKQFPLALRDDCLWAQEADDFVRVEPEKVDSSLLVGSIGFHNDHKGFYQLSQAMGLVRRKFADAKLMIIGSHNFPWQDLAFEKVKKTAALGPLLLIDRFMEISEVVRTLGLCDIIVLPYRVNSTSQSGAVETALLAGRPVITSDSEMFSHIPTGHIVAKVGVDATVKELGETIREHAVQQPSSVRLSRYRLALRRGSCLARAYDNLYESLA